METFFFIAIVLLGALAVMDLTVGVSNDAVNFLNSAIGSKVATIRTILIVAAVGILVGATSSNGMMEVARKGIFNPQLFSYYEIMMLFLAVMFGDIILLDLFNTFGMPTSTTVSLIFGLLGGAVSVASYKVWNEDVVGGISQFINSSQAMAIILGILLSVVIAFGTGMIVMYISRLIFTFNYKEKFKRYGFIWCGIVFTAIAYFAVVKGLKGTTYEPKELVKYINDNFMLAQGISLAIWSVIMLLLERLFKVNILKVSILAGTFALALAFAGNDLVNFIGVFMAGLTSYNVANGDPSHLMVELTEKSQANPYILIAAGLIMVIALFTSKKSGNVTKTEVNLARQDEGQERFGSSLVSRSIVRIAVSCSKNIERILPNSVNKFLNSRFEATAASVDSGVSFDSIRATVNLTTAAILICIATSYKLPLSTTYVTFMVAMGTSLADRAWGRESAVYRITGVLTVISGWFFTAFMAFTLAFIIGMVLMYGGFIGLGIMAVIVTYIIIQSNVLHRRRKNNEENKEQTNNIATRSEDVMANCANDIRNTVSNVSRIYGETLEAIYKEDRRALRSLTHESADLYSEASARKYKVYTTLHLLEENYVKTGHYYVQVVDYANEVTKALHRITKPALSHIQNNHQGFTEEQVEDLRLIQAKVKTIYDMIIYILEKGDYSKIEETLVIRDTLFDDIAGIVKRQISRIKLKETSTRSSMLYLEIVNETKGMIMQARNLLKSQNHFINQ